MRRLLVSVCVTMSTLWMHSNTALATEGAMLGFESKADPPTAASSPSALAIGAYSAQAPMPETSRDRFMEILPTVVYGAATGLAVAYAISLVEDKGRDQDALQWGIFLGAMTGLGVGLNHAFGRKPDAGHALLELDRNGLGRPSASSLASLRIGPERSLRVVSVRF